MNNESYHILQLMLDELKNEHQKIVIQIEDNLLKMKESDFFTNSILKNEDSNYKFFSPRDAESVHKVQIDIARENKINCKKHNEILYEKRDELLNRIQQIEKIIEKENGRDYDALLIQEEDRKRIARDLHDTSLQNLAHLVHKIELSSMYIDKDPLRAKLELSVVSKNLKSVIEEIRNTIFDLRPMSFDDLGLKAALERLIDLINENHIYETDVDIDDVSCEKNLVLVSIYRVVQECLTNIVKHAKATKIYLHCKLIDENYEIKIRDNGKGFHIEEIDNCEGKHFGISLVQERVHLIGGTISFESNSNGTDIEISIPIK